jgi:hypothetical protein
MASAKMCKTLRYVNPDLNAPTLLRLERHAAGQHRLPT